jgi:hypothetical protein
MTSNAFALSALQGPAVRDLLQHREIAAVSALTSLRDQLELIANTCVERAHVEQQRDSRT